MGRLMRRLHGGVRGSDRGSVTAELAVALPTVVVLLIAVLVVTASGATQLRCADAARAAARAAAAGEDDGRLRQIVTTVAGNEASLTTSADDPWVRVTVTAPVRGFAWAGPLEASANAVAWVEP